MDLMMTLDTKTDISLDSRQTILEFVRKFGGASSDAVLDPKCTIFSSPENKGLIGYRIESGCAVVFGDPIGEERNFIKIADQFHKHCETECSNVIYISASYQFAKMAMKKNCQAYIQFGEELVYDPKNDPREETGVNAQLVRRKVRHAQKEGTEVFEYLNPDSSLEKEIEQVGIAWLRHRKGPQVYISHVRLFDDRLGKRWFYAQKEGRVMGVLVLNLLKKKEGWLLNHVMFTPEASHGTPELLVITALEALNKEGCRYVTFGSSPSGQLGSIVGIRQPTAWIVKQAFKMAKTFFHLDGHKKFWGKFKPESVPSYLIFKNANIGVRELKALLSALNVSFQLENLKF